MASGNGELYPVRSNRHSPPANPNSYTSSTPSTPVRKVTYEKYLKIENGMSYNEVVSIIGTAGIKGQSATWGEITTIHYRWINDDDSMMVVTLKNGQVVMKDQFGLDK
ncbi:MAG: hypothetical protein ACYC6A_05960 [Armatimonadota bacterium]